MADDLKQTGKQGDQTSASKTTPDPHGAPDDPVKFQRFIDAAKAFGVNESERAFYRAMGALLKLKPKGSGS
jgi:hypothetical protein